MPMLGCGYLITMVGPDQATTPWGYTAFQVVRSLVLSTQVTTRHSPPSFHKHFIAGPCDQPALLLPEQWGPACGAVSLCQVAAGEDGGEGPVPLPHRHHTQHQHQGAGRGRQLPDTVLTMLSYMLVYVWRIITSWVTMTASMGCCVKVQVRGTNMEKVTKIAIYPW